MDVYTCLSSAFVAWILYKVFTWIWWIREKHGLMEPLPELPDRHWFWGYFHKVQCLDDILKLIGRYVCDATPTLFTTWVMFFLPVLNPVHPSCLKPVLTARNVPKNDDFAGPYRFLKTWLGDGLLCSKGDKWERNRRLLTPAFHFDILRNYVSAFNDVADTFVSRIHDAVSGGEAFDIYPLVSRATLDTMLRCSFSYKDDSVQNAGTQHPYVAAVNRLLGLVMARATNPAVYPDFIYNNTANGREFHQLCDYVHNFAAAIMETRKKQLKEDPSQLKKEHLDFLDTLLSARDADGRGLTDGEIRDEVDTFMFEGHDTTASAISWTLNCLAKYPTMQQKLREEVNAVLQGQLDLKIDYLPELSYMACFIKEVLRLYPPVPLTQRKLVEPLTLQGIQFPAGQQIDMHHYIVHRHPTLWKNPEFDPDRFLPENIAKQDPFAYIPFSAGKRNCIGQNFAMNEIKVVVAKVVQRFDISVIPGKEAIPYPEGVMRPKDGMYLNFEEI